MHVDAFHSNILYQSRALENGPHHNHFWFISLRLITNISSFQLDVTDNVEDGRMSNVIEVVLPLETSQIKLPSEDERQDQEELYQEYIVIQEGSGYLTAMDGRNILFEMSHH